MVDNVTTYGDRVSRLVGWGHWFAFFNIIAAMLIGTRYITQSPWPETLFGQFYLLISWVGHFAFLVFALYLLVLFPLTFILPSRKLFRLVSVCFATIGLTLLLIDTQAYQTINLHLNPLVWEVLFDDESTLVNNDLQHLFIVLPFIFLIEIALSEWVWRKQRKLAHKQIGKPIGSLFFVSFIASHLIYVWADAYFYNPITIQRANFPLSYPMTAKSFMEKHGLLDKAEYLKRLEQNKTNSDIVRYPLEKIDFGRRANPLNILVVSVNNLRSDMLNEETMPSAFKFAQNNLNFINHYSSSNDAFGVFGLFYGLPSSYASSIKAQGSRPILIDTLVDKDYDFGLFSGDNFDDDLYGETVFRGMSFNGIAFNESRPKDMQAIESWEEWAKQRTNKPWFSFIELTTVDNFKASKSTNKESSASDKLRSSYIRSVKQADLELERILSVIQKMELDKSTVIVITSNHATEFNETNTNSWGSNSNYSQYQLRVPMLIHWPGRVAGVYPHRTSHLDFSVTLLQELLGVTSNPTDFSSGESLFDEHKRRWILAGDSRELALITKDTTTVIDKFGNYKLFDENYQRVKDDNPTLPILMQGLTELQRFYAKNGQ